MPLTQVDANSALVVIDLQKGLVDLPLIHPFTEVAARTGRLLDAFRAAEQAVVLVNTTGGAPGRTEATRPAVKFPDDWTELVAELNVQPSDIRTTKRALGAFSGTGLEARLRSLAVTQIVLAGVATSMGVESTARQAYDLGFNVALAIDAMTDLSADAHANSVARIFPRLGETAATSDILRGLEARDIRSTHG